jgi:hypothetical protein
MLGGVVCLGHVLPLMLVDQYIWGYIRWANFNIEIILWDNNEVVGTCGHLDKGCWGVSASTPWYLQPWAPKILLQNQHDIECSNCHVYTHDWEPNVLPFAFGTNSLAMPSSQQSYPNSWNLLWLLTPKCWVVWKIRKHSTPCSIWRTGWGTCLRPA